MTATVSAPGARGDRAQAASDREHDENGAVDVPFSHHGDPSEAMFVPVPISPGMTRFGA